MLSRLTHFLFISLKIAAVFFFHKWTTNLNFWLFDIAFDLCEFDKSVYRCIIAMPVVLKYKFARSNLCACMYEWCNIFRWRYQVLSVLEVIINNRKGVYKTTTTILIISIKVWLHSTRRNNRPKVSTILNAENAVAEKQALIRGSLSVSTKLRQTISTTTKNKQPLHTHYTHIFIIFYLCITIIFVCLYFCFSTFGRSVSERETCIPCTKMNYLLCFALFQPWKSFMKNFERAVRQMKSQRFLYKCRLSLYYNIW